MKRHKILLICQQSSSDCNIAICIAPTSVRCSQCRSNTNLMLVGLDYHIHCQLPFRSAWHNFYSIINPETGIRYYQIIRSKHKHGYSVSLIS